jgi:nicotinate-nucleotide adenylyltransferase
LSAKPVRPARGKAPGGRQIALFGGTFDPIHLGHLAVAQAALRAFRLDRVFFIPSGHPPHKPLGELHAYEHRFAMVALACAGNRCFVPSLAERADGAGPIAFYSVDTVRRFRTEYGRPGDRLYFIVGADSFLQIATWKDYHTLLGLCDFVVASRPGFRTDTLLQVIPRELLANSAQSASKGATRKGPHGSRSIALRDSTVHLLDTVASRVSATDVRHRLDRGRSVHGLVPPRVEEYITKQALYRPQ